MKYRDTDGVDYPAKCWCGLRADIRVFADDGGMIGAVCSYHIPESAGPIYDDENVEEAQIGCCGFQDAIVEGDEGEFWLVGCNYGR